MRALRYLLVPLGLLLCACGGPVLLHRGAEQVEILRDRPAGESREIGEVWCRLGSNARSLRSNVDDCRNHLRNDAYARGADFVVIYIEQLGVECPNCVYFLAHMHVRDDGRGRR